MIEREVEIAGTKRPGFYVAPDRTSGPPRGAVVVLHEIFGRTPELERACRRMAERGWAALMPDLFGGRLRPICISRAVAAIRRGQGPDIDAIAAAAQTLAELSGIERARVGVIGFCLGGGFALAVGHAFAASSSNYGSLIPADDALRITTPTIVCYGARDKTTRKPGAKVRARLAQADVPHEVHVFDAGHAFLTDGDRPIGAFMTRWLMSVDPVRDADAREEGWSKIFAFFDRHLAVEHAST